MNNTENNEDKKVYKNYGFDFKRYMKGRIKICIAIIVIIFALAAVGTIYLRCAGYGDINLVAMVAEGIFGGREYTPTEEIEGDEHGYRPGETKDNINLQTTTDVEKNTPGNLPYENYDEAYNNENAQQPLDSTSPFGYYYIAPRYEDELCFYFVAIFNKSDDVIYIRMDDRSQYDEDAEYYLNTVVPNARYEGEDASLEVNKYGEWVLTLDYTEYELLEPNSYVETSDEYLNDDDIDNYEAYLHGYYSCVDDNGKVYYHVGINKFFDSEYLYFELYDADYNFEGYKILGNDYSYPGATIYNNIFDPTGDSITIECIPYEITTIEISNGEVDDIYGLIPNYDIEDWYRPLNSGYANGSYEIKLEDGTTGTLSLSSIFVNESQLGYRYIIETDTIRTEGIAAPQTPYGNTLISNDTYIDLQSMEIAIPGLLGEKAFGTIIKG